jgi:hypothetical protein
MRSRGKRSQEKDFFDAPSLKKVLRGWVCYIERESISYFIQQGRKDEILKWYMYLGFKE